MVLGQLALNCGIVFTPFVFDVDDITIETGLEVVVGHVLHVNWYREEVIRQSLLAEDLICRVDICLRDSDKREGLGCLIELKRLASWVKALELRDCTFNGSIHIGGSDVHLVWIVLKLVKYFALNLVSISHFQAHQVMLPLADLSELSTAPVGAGLIKVIFIQTVSGAMSGDFISEEQLVGCRGRRLGDTG